MIPKACKSFPEVGFRIVTLRPHGTGGVRSGQLRLIELKGLGRRDRDDSADAERTSRRRGPPRLLLALCGHRLPAASRDAAQVGAAKPTLQEPIKDPACFPWHEVTKVAHYWLEVDGMTRPMQVRENAPQYSPQRPGEH